MKLQEYLETYDIPLTEIARACGVAQSTMHAMLSKGAIPKVDLALKVEEVTNGIVTVRDFVEDSRDVDRIDTTLKVERVAKAIYGVFIGGVFRNPSTDDVNTRWAKANERTRNNFREEAIAAINAMKG